MFKFDFAHNGVHHGTETEALTHEASDSTIWIVVGSVVTAVAIYSVIRWLNKRQALQESKEDQEL